MAFDLHVPPSIDPSIIAASFGRDKDTGQPIADGDLQSAFEAMQFAQAQARNVVEVAEAYEKDPTVPRPKAALELRRAGQRAGETASRALDAACTRVRASIARLETQIGRPPVSTDAGAMLLAGEVRAALRAMAPKARSAAINAAFAEDDDRVLGALLNGPALLSGHTADEQRALSARYARTRHPEATARLARLQKALGGLERAGAGLIGFTRRATTLDAALAAEEASARTQAALDKIAS